MEERVKKILVENDLNWGIIKTPLSYEFEDQEHLSKKVSVIRDDNGSELNVAGTGYVPMQNERMVEATLQASDNYGEIELIKSGHFMGGKRVYMQFRIKGTHAIGEEKLERYITLINFNDGTGSFKFAVGNMVMSCTNQFHYFDKEAKLSFKHSSGLIDIASHLDQHIETALATELKMIERFNTFNSSFASKELANLMIKEIITKDFSYRENQKLSTRMKNKEEMFLEAIDIEMKSKGHTAFGLFNGFTYATNHFMNSNSEDALFKGSKARINKEAYEFLEKKLVLS